MKIHIKSIQPSENPWDQPTQHQTFRDLKWRNPHLYKQYGYGVCKGKLRSKQPYKTQYFHFRHLKLLVMEYLNIPKMAIWVTDKIWYMAKGHPKVGWAPIGFAVAAPCANLPEGIVLGIVLGWAPIGFAAMATPTTLSILLWSYLILSDTHIFFSKGATGIPKSANQDTLLIKSTTAKITPLIGITTNTLIWTTSGSKQVTVFPRGWRKNHVTVLQRTLSELHLT